MRRGLVLGAGGVLGAAWSVGALRALEEVRGQDPRASEVVVGTSAGSVLAALVGAGLSADELHRHQLGEPLPGREIAWDHERGSGPALPPLPRPGPGSVNLLRTSALHPGQVRPLVTLVGLLPRGRGSLEPLARAVRSVVPEGEWAPREGVWVVAVDYGSGARTVFGREGAPPAGLAEAVTASCAIPGWYAPVVVGGREYVDGGSHSPASADLLAGLGLDEVVVLAPTASLHPDSPTSVPARLERRWRRRVTGGLLREVAAVEASGTRVTLLTPGPEDLAAMGANLMDPARRLDVLETSLRTNRVALARLPAARGVRGRSRRGEPRAAAREPGEPGDGRLAR